LFQLLSTGIVYFLAVKYQKAFLDNHFEKKGKKASAWKAAGIGLVALAVTVIPIFALAYFEPTLDGKYVHVGKLNHEVFYSDDVSQINAKKVGGLLLDAEYFDNEFQGFVKLSKEKGVIKISFPLAPEYWNDNETIDSYKEMSLFIKEENPVSDYVYYIFKYGLDADDVERKLL